MNESFMEKIQNALADAMILGGILFIAAHIALSISLLRQKSLCRRLIYGFVLFTLLYFAAVVNIVNGKETQRMRVYVGPIVFVMATGVLLNGISRGASGPNGSRNEALPNSDRQRSV
jgi:mannose/fructose/N-acetylgalactosamine-specific phosphotransferase system component IIC